MLAAPDRQPSKDRSFWVNSPIRCERSRSENNDTVNLRCAIMGDAFGGTWHFRPAPFIRRSPDSGTHTAGRSCASNCDPSISLTDQLLLGVITQGFAMSGGWYQSSSLTVKTNGDTGRQIWCPCLVGAFHDAL